MRAIAASYQRGGFGAGMAHFIAIVAHKGEFPDDIASAAGAGPGDVRDAGRATTARATDVMLGQNIITCTHYEPDFDALRAASTRDRPRRRRPSPRARWPAAGAHAVAERLGTQAVRLPQRSRRLPGRRVRPDRRARRLRREAPRGARRERLNRLNRANRPDSAGPHGAVGAMRPGGASVCPAPVSCRATVRWRAAPP